MFDLPFSLEIPVKLGNLYLSFWVTETLHAVNEECISLPHNHGSHYEIRYIVKGSGKQVIGETLIEANPGDLILIYPGEYHYQAGEGVTPELEQYNLRFFLKEPAEDAAKSQIRAYGELTAALRNIRCAYDENARLKDLFQRLTKEIQCKEIGYFYNLQALCSVIFTELLRLLPQTALVHAFPSEELKYNGYCRLQIDHFLKDHYGEAVCLQDLSDTIGLSKRQTQRLIQREYGMGYSQKLMETRVQFAKYRLLHTDTPIQQIAYDCGFQSYGYFLTCFRKLTGQSPATVRKQKKDS